MSSSSFKYNVLLALNDDKEEEEENEDEVVVVNGLYRSQ